MQAAILDEFTIPSGGIRQMARHVKSGDARNHEAQAAQRYWPLLMGKTFRRDRHGQPPNNLLNFGYAIMRSAVARAICLAGLHPGIGLFHQSRSNVFPLADDLMEVWRPVIDWRVRQIMQEEQEMNDLDKQTKKHLLSVFYESVRLGEDSFPVLLAVQRMVTSVALSFEQKGTAASAGWHGPPAQLSGFSLMTSVQVTPLGWRTMWIIALFDLPTASKTPASAICPFSA